MRRGTGRTELSSLSHESCSTGRLPLCYSQGLQAPAACSAPSRCPYHLLELLVVGLQHLGQNGRLAHRDALVIVHKAGASSPCLQAATLLRSATHAASH